MRHSLPWSSLTGSVSVLYACQTWPALDVLTEGPCVREGPLMTSDDFRRFLTYLPTFFNPKTSDFLVKFEPPLPTLKSDVINGHSLICKSLDVLNTSHNWLLKALAVNNDLQKPLMYQVVNTW